MLVDSRAASKITQGITTEITGEGVSIAPVNDAMMADRKASYDFFKVAHDWRTLDEYFARLDEVDAGDQHRHVRRLGRAARLRDRQGRPRRPPPPRWRR